nr:ABC transporter permease subunit [Thermus albus]
MAFLLPLLWTLRSALLPEGLAYALPPAWGPWTLENFQQVLSGPFGKAFQNSLQVASLVVLLGLPLAAGLGYAMARYRLGGHGLRFAVLAVQMIPPIVLALPLFALMRLLGLSGSLASLVLAYLAFALPFMAWLLLGFFQGLPRELEEAAYVDGATPLQAFLRVTLPLLRPVVAVLLILQTLTEIRTYDLVYVLTRGGPGTATDLVSYYIYRKAFLGLDLSGAAAMSYILLLTLALVGAYYRVLTRS